MARCDVCNEHCDGDKLQTLIKELREDEPKIRDICQTCLKRLELETSAQFEAIELEALEKKRAVWRRARKMLGVWALGEHTFTLMEPEPPPPKRESIADAVRRKFGHLL